MNSNTTVKKMNTDLELDNRPDSYGGDDPYIFISYAHKDATEVYDLIRALQKKHLRVSYDEGITAGLEWTDYIAKRIKSCHCICPMFSKEYWKSEMCTKELRFAVKNNVPHFAIHLCENEVPDGIDLLWGDVQDVFAYQYSDEEKLLKKLLGADQFEMCKVKTSGSADEKSIDQDKINLYQEIAQDGDAFAQSKLGQYCEQDKNFEKAVDWYTMSAKRGNMFAMSRLGYCYDMIAQKNYKDAFEAHKNMAEQGDAYGQFETGYHYEKGLGAAVNIKKAREWYKAADENGYKKAAGALKRLDGGTDKTGPPQK